MEAVSVNATTNDESQRPRLKYALPVYIAAARVRVTADRRLGLTTPEAIRRLARGDVDHHVREAIHAESERRHRTKNAPIASDTPRSRWDIDVYFAAAELRVATDRRLGIETPENIRRLARGEIDPTVRRALVGDDIKDYPRPETSSGSGGVF